MLASTSCAISIYNGQLYSPPICSGDKTSEGSDTETPDPMVKFSKEKKRRPSLMGLCFDQHTYSIDSIHGTVWESSSSPCYCLYFFGAIWLSYDTITCVRHTCIIRTWRLAEEAVVPTSKYKDPVLSPTIAKRPVESQEKQEASTLKPFRSTSRF